MDEVLKLEEHHATLTPSDGSTRIECFYYVIFGNDGAITGAGYTRLGKAVSNAAVSSLQRD